MAKFQISKSFYSPSYTRTGGSSLARRPGHTNGDDDGMSSTKKKMVSALVVIGSAAVVSYAEVKWGLPAIRFSKEGEKPTMLDHFGTSDFLGGAAILALSFWGKIPAKYDGIASDIAKGTLAHWASVTVFNAVEHPKETTSTWKNPTKHPITMGTVSGQLNAAGRRAVDPDKAWQGQFATRG